MPRLSLERSADVAGIEAAHAGFEAGGDMAFAVPRLGGMGKACEGPHFLGYGFGAAHLEIVGRGRRQGVQLDLDPTAACW